MSTMRSILFVASLLVAAVSAQTIVSNTVGNFTLAASGSSATASFPLFAGSVVGAATNITLTQTAVVSSTINICIQRVLPLPESASSWSKQSCSVFAQVVVDSAVEVISVPYLNVASTFGIALVSGNASTFTVTASASVCAVGQVASPFLKCEKTSSLNNGAVEITLNSPSAEYLNFNVAQPDSSALTVKFTPTGNVPAPIAAPVTAPASAPVSAPVAEVAPVAAPVGQAAPATSKRAIAADDMMMVYARFGAAPRGDDTDDYVFNVTSAGSVTVPAPQPGNWFFAVFRESNTVISVSAAASLTACANSSVSGPACDADFAPFLGNVSANTVGNAVVRNVTQGLTFFRISRASLTSRLVVGVSGLRPGKFPANVTLYINVGGIPTTSSPVWTGCDEGPCTAVQFANFTANFLVQGDIWIGVGNANASDQVIAWRDSACANNCNGQGTCLADASTERFGQCDCQNLYEGVDCSVKPSGLDIRVIVLIIIGSLLVLTALVGLIAWIISRRQSRAGYSEVA